MRGVVNVCIVACTLGLWRKHRWNLEAFCVWVSKLNRGESRRSFWQSIWTGALCWLPKHYHTQIIAKLKRGKLSCCHIHCSPSLPLKVPRTQLTIYLLFEGILLPLTWIQRGSPSFEEEEIQNTGHRSNEMNCTWISIKGLINFSRQIALGRSFAIKAQRSYLIRR